MKNLRFFGGSFFKIKIADILHFQWNKYLGKGLSYSRYWGIEVYYCWNYRPSKLLLNFIKYRLDQLNNKHTKIVINSAIQYFEGRSQKKCLLKVSLHKKTRGNCGFSHIYWWNPEWKTFFVQCLKFFCPSTIKWRPCKTIAKLNGNHVLMTNVFKPHARRSDIWFNQNA